MSTTDPHQEEHADGIVEDREQAPPVYFTILFYGLIIWGIAFMAFYLLSGWSSDAEFAEKMAKHKGEPVAKVEPVAEQQPAKATEAPAAQAPAAAEADGAALYSQHCSGCHGADGKGSFGPDLSGDYQYGKTPEAATESIAQGRPGNMPAFEGKLSAEETQALVNFILAL
ncbi:MAG: c-type cytochrome [Desulfuromonadales bacterium]|nr:c-type cytochrome [Desulfuromonadales bacterium]